MARFKFLLFALPALGLWAWQLVSSSTRQSEVTVRQAERVASAARPVFQARLGEEQLRLQGLLAQGATVWSSLPQAGLRSGLKGEALSGAFQSLRTALAANLPDQRKSALVLLLSSNGSSLVSRGQTDPTDSTDGLELASALQAGTDGAILDAFGTPHQFYALALSPADRGGVTLVVGCPLVSWEITDGVARETGLAAVGLVRAGKLLAASGPEKSVLAGLAQPKGKKPALEGVRGPALNLGPIPLPLVDGEPFKSVVSRSALPGTNLEVLGLVSVEPAMKELAESQQLALLFLVGLSVVGGVLLVSMGSAPAPGMSVVRPGSRRAPPPSSEDAPGPGRTTTAEALPVMDAPSAAEAHPDDFHFPGLGQTPPPVPTNELPAYPPEQDSASPLPPPPVPPDAEQVTTIASPASMFAANGAAGDEEFNPDATRVASVPAELIQQSAQMEGFPAAPPPFPLAPAEADPNSDDVHFQRIYREFLNTRERCGESADGLTFDRFAQKLRKNREQLVQKYACRTVRFQVYVKEGKAALKATPVRD